MNRILFIEDVKAALAFEQRPKYLRYTVNYSAATNRISTEDRERIFLRLRYEHEVNIGLHIP